jgi:hypothetical protein
MTHKEVTVEEFIAAIKRGVPYADFVLKIGTEAEPLTIGVSYTTPLLLLFRPNTKVLKRIRTEQVNGVTCVKPETTAPELGTMVYVPSLASQAFYITRTWGDTEYDKMWLARGLIYLEAEHAAQRAKAILNIKENPSELPRTPA